MIEKVSQSFIKEAREYFAGIGCGNIIRERYINGRLFESEEPGAMELGSYFEYVLTLKLVGKGSLPKGGKTPQPVYMKTPLKDVAAKKRTMESLGIDDMEAAYRKAHKLADRIVAQMKEMGLEVISAGETIEKDSFVGTIDLKCKCTKDMNFGNIQWKAGDIIVIDLKLSGLLNDRWSKHGWGWSPIQKEYHGTQAKHYTMLTDYPFYFWVNQSNQKEEDDADIRLFYIPVTEDMIDSHVSEANALFIKFRNEAEYGFVARPSLTRCSECPLRNECPDRHTFPHPETVDLTIA